MAVGQVLYYGNENLGVKTCLIVTLKKIMLQCKNV